MEGKSRQYLPFKGGGTTRIVGSDECAPELGDVKKDQRKVDEANAKCVVTASLANGYVLLNRCTACRQTIVRVTYDDGSERNLPLAIQARKIVKVPRGTAVGLAVIHERTCKD